MLNSYLGYSYKHLLLTYKEITSVLQVAGIYKLRKMFTQLKKFNILDNILKYVYVLSMSSRAYLYFNLHLSSTTFPICVFF